MPYLLDTHVLLRWRLDDPRLPHRWDQVFGHPRGDEILFSLVPVWEIAIKRGLGKLRLDAAASSPQRPAHRLVPARGPTAGRGLPNFVTIVTKFGSAAGLARGVGRDSRRGGGMLHDLLAMSRESEGLAGRRVAARVGA
jgi:hypothetical protein